MADHDHSYKLLFSHPEMVRDLLQGFVHQAWVKQLDFSTLERVNGSYISDDLREREDDIIWRVRQGGKWTYIYLLLEFQSQPDSWMALRMLVYVGLLYQGLIKEGLVASAEQLPPVFPLVLYNGSRPWTASQEVSELIAPLPGGLADYRPSLRYLLLDEGRYTERDLPTSENLAAALFRLENSQAPDELRAVIRTLAQWIYAPEQASLRRAFTVWIKRVLLPGKLPEVVLPETADLNEVDNMLAERVQEWTRQWKAEGLEEGLGKGLERGLEEGLLKGREEGREEGFEEGYKNGEMVFLIRLLERRFGPLDDARKARLETADAKRLLVWGERILTAESLEEVFRDQP